MVYVLEAVENDNPGMRDDFEACVAYLIPMDPMTRKKSKAESKKKIGGIVSAVSFDPKSKKGKGESGVEIFWHKDSYFHQLYQPQSGSHPR